LPKAIIISTVFPPLGTAGGSIRLVKFLKYISDWGWDFVVFTQDVQHPIVPEQILSSFLSDELPADIRVERIAAPFSPSQTDKRLSLINRASVYLFRKLFRDSALPWGLRVFLHGLKLTRESKIDLVYGTAPPFTNALIAMLLGWAARKPFVLDLRDDWVGLPIFFRKNILRQKFEIFLESLIVRRASAIVTVTPQSQRLYQERYAHLGQKGKFHLIPNGCDLAEYESLEKREKQIASDRFLVLSAAWWYKKGHRDITPFLLGLHALFERRPDLRKKIEIVMLGNSLSSEYDHLLSELKLEDVIHRLHAVERKELVEWLWKADLFLLIQPVNNRTAISGTLYEYWATGKAPILLISEQGASSELIEKHRIGRHFHFHQVEEIADHIEELFEAYEHGQPLWIERREIQNYDRKVLAKRMSDIWNKLISKR
jgi:glycosyltransferase involved in cell wall biosynthesis